MQSFEEIKTLVAAIEADVVKFTEKKNVSAGTRIRKAMQNLKTLAQQVRLDVQEAKNQD